MKKNKEKNNLKNSFLEKNPKSKLKLIYNLILSNSMIQ